jgi:hypothetical protein
MTTVPSDDAIADAPFGVGDLARQRGVRSRAADEITPFALPMGSPIYAAFVATGSSTTHETK